MTDDELLSDRVAAQGVRDLLDGKLTGPLLPGTLAWRVNEALLKAAELGHHGFLWKSKSNWDPYWR